MADNERIQHDLYDKEDFLQDAPAKANRTMFTPGKVSSLPLDENWPVEFNIKTGVNAVDSSERQHVRVLKLHRNSISDQTIPAPTVTGTTVVTVVDEAGGVEGEHTMTDTVTQENDGTQERTTGSENVKP